MRHSISLLLSLLCLFPTLASARDDGSTDDDEALDGKSPASDKARSQPQDGKTPAGATAKQESPSGLVGLVVTPRDPGANEAAAALELALTEAVSADGRLTPVDLLAKLGGEPVGAGPSDAVLEFFKKGKDAYDNLDLGVAAKEYLEGLKLMLDDPSTARPTEVARALTLAGASHLLNGENAKASGAFRRATLIGPEFVPNPEEFSPDILSAYEEARKAVASGEKGNLTLTSNVSPTLVLVDGSDRGVAPLTLKGLGVGRHHVLLESRGFQPWAKFI
ncbi:MAG: PEGA domain-containing protein [Deltaproteobacteria bacterium]|nr:PEGA domain-containing protein [Deltaproteobacteria bacterium]